METNNDKVKKTKSKIIQLMQIQQLWKLITLKQILGIE